MAKKTKSEKETVPETRPSMIWRCDCGHRITLTNSLDATRRCPKCGRLDTFTIRHRKGPEVVTK